MPRGDNMNEIKKMVDWFDKTNSQKSDWYAKVVFKKSGALIARTFIKSECDNGVESHYVGYCDALKDLGISYIAQMKGYSLWYFSKGGANAEKIRES